MPVRVLSNSGWVEHWRSALFLFVFVEVWLVGEIFLFCLSVVSEALASHAVLKVLLPNFVSISPR